MKISELLEANEFDTDHYRALADTGFWGNKGAGTMIMAQTTRRFLVPERSQYVQEPLTWGTWGGAIDGNESPEQAVDREIQEETGYTGPKKIIPLYVFKKASFRYYNFLTIVKDEFTPHLDWETKSFRWVKFGDWPKPLHFGLVGILENPESLRILQQVSKNEY